MLTFDDFARIVSEEVNLLPSYVHEKLDGGVLADSDVYLHPNRLSDDLYILGTYSVYLYPNRASSGNKGGNENTGRRGCSEDAGLL